MSAKRKYQIITGIFLFLVLVLLARQIYYYISYGLCLIGGAASPAVKEQILAMKQNYEILFRISSVYDKLYMATELIMFISGIWYFFLNEDHLKGNRKVFWWGFGIVILCRLFLKLYIAYVQIYPEFLRVFVYLPFYVWLFVVASTLQPLEE